jgi:hypothetical protein
MAYAALNDVNVHLPADKLQAQDADIINLNVDAQRLIRARLASVFDLALMNTWVSPADTPEAIRRIAGKLVAAKFYAILAAEDDSDGSLYAQNLYNECVLELNEIRQGTETVIDVSGNEISNDSLSETGFYPNNTTQPPSFSVSEVWS